MGLDSCDTGIIILLVRAKVRWDCRGAGEDLLRRKTMITATSYYVNPNTRGLTSDYKNTMIKDQQAYDNLPHQHLLKPVEDLTQVLKAPIKLAGSSSLSRERNSVNIAEGKNIQVNDGYVLTVTSGGVVVSGSDNPYDTEAYAKAQRMADSLTSLLRNAGGTMNVVAHSKEEYGRYTEGILQAH